MRVDGGKAITSRGQVDWYGQMSMTRKFENDLTSFLSFKVSKQQPKPIPNSGDADALDDWVDDIQISRWAVKTDEAHLKQASAYSNHTENMNHLAYQQEQHEKAGALFNPKIAN